MSISPIGANSMAYASALQQAPQTRETRPDRENDGDQDDGVAATQSPKPTVNLEGQTVGRLVDITA